ncbi:S8 family serine peptidase [Spirosoma koreense]
MLQRLHAYKSGLFSGLFLFLGITASLAQPLPYSAAQRQRIESLRQTLQKTYETDYSRALSLAKLLGRPVREVRSNGQVLMLAGIDAYGNLLYYNTHVGNAQVAVLTGTAALYSGGSLGLNLSGSSASVQTKLGIWDGGAVRATHVELAGRVTQVDKASTTVSDEEHPTHVSTTMIGAGVNPQARGMAFGAKLQAWDFNSDVSEMTAAAPNLLVSNHSYGTTAGFQYNPDQTGTTQWLWYGDTTVSRTYDYKFGLYDRSAQSWDQIANNAPYYLMVKSAGNDHGSYPGDGQPYLLVNYNKKISTAPRDNQMGYDQISTSGNAKNILLVGAISAPANGYNYPGDAKLADFSSWGPTDDGRIKPDIVGIGVSVLSGNSASDNAYETLSGTSMASPNVSGSVLLLQEYYAQLNAGKYMRSSTLRGLVIHTANETGTTPGPDYQYGWGMLNTERAARVIGNTDKSNLLSERTLAQGQRDTLQVVASGRGPLVVSIGWNDPAGTASTALNDRTPKLVNDLDVRVSDGKTTSQPWTLDPANPTNAATPGDNIRDNIEQIRIDNAVPGQTYTIAVTHKNTLRNNQQDYALIVSGIGGTAYCASAPTSTADTRISRVQFGSINQAGPDGCTAYTDFTKTTTTIQAGQVIPLTVSLGTCGAQKNVVVKAFADWNANGTFLETGETLVTSGVLANTGVFTANVTVPASVTVGQLIRLRVVATETSDPNAVNACGSYGNGETQDYVLNVVQTSNDVGAIALISPEASFCGLSSTSITVGVRIRSYGTATQTNIPVTVKITDANNAELATLTGTVPSIAPFSDALLTLQSPAITLSSGQSYKFVVSTNLTTDQNPTNNTVTETRTTATAPTGLFTATRCGSDTLISLQNTGGGAAFWYDAPTGGNLLAVGNQTSVKLIPASGQFYATLNDFSGTIGPVDKKAFGGGTYSGNFGPSPLITTAVPLTIESARLYIGTAGQLTFTVRKYDNTAVSSVTLDVTPTRNQSLTATSNGQLVDDPNDPGAVYPLNLHIPEAGNYQITIEYGNGASIFRSNAGVSGFPYQLKTSTGAPIVTIKGSLYARSSTVTDTLTDAWYYLYNIKVRSLDCPSPQRTAVTPTTGAAATATITPSGSVSLCQGSTATLQANTGTGLSYQWYNSGQLISGATSSTLQVSSAGSYAVQVANSCLPVRSSAVAVSVRNAVTPTITFDSYILSTNAVSNIQWLLDGVAISGAVGSTYSATKTGRYSVKGSVNGCGEVISNEVYVTILATEPVSSVGTLNVYPNPATQQITVSVSASTSLRGTPTLRLVDLRGLTIGTATLQRDGTTYSTTMDVTRLPGGVFFVVVEDEKAQRLGVRQISKQ